MAETTPTKEEAIELFTSLEQHFPSSTLGPDRWYIVAITALCGGGHPGFAADLYTYLLAQPRFQSSESRRALMRRLREALVKCISIVGVPKPLEAVLCIARVEKDEDKDYSFSREHWQSGEANRKRGKDLIKQIYQHNLTQTLNPFEAHKDLVWITEEITYGLYLSDHTILDGIDTEMVVLPGIMIQNLKRETGWHLRGTRRIGVSKDDVELIQQCVEKVAAFCGLRLSKVPRVVDIEHEV